MQKRRRNIWIVLWCVCGIGIAAGQTPYISHVWEYSPAPGQFVNELPVYSDGDDSEAMRAKAEASIAQNAGHAITLGGWGGYVVFGFDHEVQNVAGEADFIVLGNAFYSNVDHPENGGSSEPGVVYVSRDANGNGLPDDPWYELAGSEFAQSNRSYRVTYFRPAEGHVRTPKPSDNLIDTTYIFWRDINGATGYMPQNQYHLQPYYPQWQSADRWVFEGTLLPPNAVPYQESGRTKYNLLNYAYGYADNHPNSATAAQLDIDWAVTASGQPAGLTGIHFVKVQSGTHQQCGWIGEISTEVCGATDLHMPANLSSTNRSNALTPVKRIENGMLIIITSAGTRYTATGQRME